MSYSPWAHVGTMPDVEVWTGDRLTYAEAYWVPEQRVILLDAGLGQAARRSCLAHEVAHIEAGDVCCDIGPDGGRQSRRQEVRADDRASKRLITLEELADALLWCLGVDELAEYLHVDTRTVRARVRSLTSAEKEDIESRIAAREGAL